MTLEDLANKKICILGLGIENYAMLKFLLKKKIPADITVCDAITKKELKERYGACVKSINCKLGKYYDDELSRHDIIFRVAGYPLFTPAVIKAMVKGVTVTSPTKLFFDLAPTENIIGVTGAKGKGTTASLIYAILRAAKKRAYFGGNIGVPMFGFFDKIKPNDWVVLELSSFQLEDLKISPHIAVITNFFPEHLSPADPHNPNHHKTVAAYWEAKSNIFAHQNKDDFLVVAADLQSKLRHEKIFSKISYFNTSDFPTPLLGNHNKKNIAPAAMAAALAGVKDNTVKKSVAAFTGLEHRLEFIGVKNNIRYYNDSFATVPEAAITALKAFDTKNIILIAGGVGKGANFAAFVRELKKRGLRTVLLPGKGSDEIQKEFVKKG